VPEPSRPTAATRVRDGRWLAGVCRGLAEVRELDVVWLRLGFVALSLFGGIGIALYAACWLIMPTDAEGEADARGGRGAVWLAQALGACIALLLLAALGTVATVFGFGWIVFAVAAAVLVGTLAIRRLGPAWPLLPVAALALPSVAVAAGGLSLTTRTAPSEIRIASVAALQDHTFRSGLNTMLIDLRHTRLPRTGQVKLNIRTGLRRTIVALPHDACVHAQVDYRVNPFPMRMASLLTGRGDHAFADMFLFGRVNFGRTVDLGKGPGARPGPTLVIHADSEGGSLYVRDYPDSVNPDIEPDWPGYPVGLEPRPITTGTTRAGARHEIRAWRVRRRHERADAVRVNDLRPGPCAAP
jgi:phage shock protein PspC (stress-responsive transcriptional regulator)